jgi:hypothetical protein
MTKKRTSHKTPKPRGVASGIPVFCLHDEIVDAASLKLWSEQPGQKNPQVHPAKQLDRYELVVAGDGRKPGNGFRRCAVVSTLSGCVTKGNGLVMMARRRGWQVPIERQAYANRAEEIRDVAADNRIAEMAEHDDDALKKMLGELDPGEIQFAAVSAEEFEQLLADADIPEGEFPITSKLNESYDYVLIFTTNATEHAFLQNLLGVRVERSYKKTGIGIGRAISLARAVESLRANRHSLDVQSGDNDHAQPHSQRPRVRPPKPASRVRASRRK